MRILVTGVTGFVGRRLANTLSERGDEVIGLSRRPESASKKVPALAGAYAWAGAGGAPDRRCFDGVDAVVHLAGEPVSGRWTTAKRERIERSRIEGTAHLVEAIRALEDRPKVFVSASAMGIYGDRGEVELTESASFGDDFLARICVGWEREACVAEELGVRVAIARIGLVLGLEGGALKSMLPAFRAGVGGRIGPGEQWWSWIHEDDLVALLIRMIDDDGMSGPYNAVSPQPIRQKAFAETLGKVLRRPTFLPTPSFALRIAMGEFVEEMTASRRLLPARAVEQGFRFRFDALKPALTDLLSS